MMKKVTLSIGNKRSIPFWKLPREKAGFSFLEVMTAVVILATGVVLIYRSFLASLDIQAHLQNRLAALALIEDRSARLERFYQENHKLPFDTRGQLLTSKVGFREVPFQLTVTVRPMEPLKNMAVVFLELSWPERARDYTLSRSLFFYHPEAKDLPAGGS